MSISSILDLYSRPFVLAIACFLIYNFQNVIFRLKMTLQGISYLLFCNDKSWPKQPCPSSFFNDDNSSSKSIEKKTIVFVRHGESTWNDTFNKGSHRSTATFVIGYIPGLVKALAYETYLTLAGMVDSWFYDSPLSHLGLSQVAQLCEFLRQKPKDVTKDPDEQLLLSIIRNDDPKSPKSILVSSSLRRAISTMAGSFQDRLIRNPHESILVLPCLQEISRNPDTLSITPPHTRVTPSWIDRDSKQCDFKKIFANRVDMSLHIGNKPIDTNGFKRMNEFCSLVFSNVEENYIIVGGHSIYYRSFFREFLPKASDHIGKKKKIVNCGAVAFDLLKSREDGAERFMIDEKSIRVVYGGFK